MAGADQISPAQTASAPPAFAYRNFGAFRLLLAALVVVQHYCAGLAPEPLMLLAQPYEVGGMAVLAFFALSGFVITEAVETLYRRRPGAFLLNRMLRVFPQYLLAVAIAMAIYAVFRPEGFPSAAAYDPMNIVGNLFGILPLSDRMTSFDFVEIAWAVRVEVAYYIVVAAAIIVASFLGRRRAGNGSIAGPGLLIAALLVVPFILALQGRGIAMLQYLPYFVFGSALYYGFTHARPLAHAVTAVSGAAIIWHVGAAPGQHATLGFERATVAQLFLIIALLGAMTVLAARPSPQASALDKTLGDFTYPLYMSHQNLVIPLLAVSGGPSYGALAAGFVLCVGVAIASHRLLDPFVDRLRDSVRGRRL